MHAESYSGQSALKTSTEVIATRSTRWVMMSSLRRKFSASKLCACLRAAHRGTASSTAARSLSGTCMSVCTSVGKPVSSLANEAMFANSNSGRSGVGVLIRSMFDLKPSVPVRRSRRCGGHPGLFPELSGRLKERSGQAIWKGGSQQHGGCVRVARRRVCACLSLSVRGVTGSSWAPSRVRPA